MAIHLKQFATVSDDRHAVFSRRPSSGSFYDRYGKRLLDILIVLAAAPFVVPLVAVLACLIALDGGAPFYRQMRVGRDGVGFRLLKLRTMVCDADARLESYLMADPQARSEWDRTQKLKADPRITALGKFLRSSSLDELPQLWNVLIGDMSLIGPRPMMMGQVSLYPGNAYYAMRPGITGFWQVSERNLSTFADRAIFDTDYHAQISLKTDVSVLVKTVGVVMRRTGY